MKFAKIATVFFLMLVIGLAGCKQSGSGSGGASSPQKLFDEMKGKNRDDFGMMVKYIAPDELPIMAFSMDFMLAFMTKFSKDKNIEDEYTRIRAKYKLPVISMNDPKININDQEAMWKYAQETYGKVDCAGFLKDVEALVAKLPGEKEKKALEKVPFVELKDVKIEGDKATGMVVLENKNTEPVHFRKVDGKWYFSIKDSMMAR